jgi:hypothetical protein
MRIWSRSTRSWPPQERHGGWRARAAYPVTHAPLVVKDKVIVGVGGGEHGFAGSSPHDAADAKMWRF